MRRREHLRALSGLGLFVGATTPDPASAAERALPQVTSRVLANGMRIVVAERRDLPIAAVLLGLRSLPGDDQGRAGLIQLTAEMVASQIEQRPARATTRLQPLELTSQVGADHVEFAGACLSEDIETLVQLLAQGVMRPDLSPQSLLKARTRAVQNLQPGRLQPQQVARRALLRLVYGSHPYARLLPSGLEVAALQPADVQAHHAGCYRPERATLVVVGDVRGTQILERIQALFDCWPCAAPGLQPHLPPSETAAAVPPTSSSTKIYWIEQSTAVQATILAGQVAAARSHSAYLPLALANTIFGGTSLSSRLMASLREKWGYTYTPSSTCTAFTGPGTFEVLVETRNAVCRPALEQLFYELERMGKAGVTEEELRLAKNRFCVGRLLQAQTRFGLARQLLEDSLYTAKTDDCNAPCRLAAAVSAAEILQAVRQYMTSSGTVAVVVGNTDVLAQLRAVWSVNRIDGTRQ